ncbi:MAG TPA: hypothetical protein VJT73_05200, partial [Polyangiaceae bacterium]|nr:hypothetical protein [Polyangiaceae bacterium]
NAMLWPVRLVVDFVFFATGIAGGLLENEQIVPRARDFFFTQGGELGVFPTLFLETGFNPNAGARLIAGVGPYGATVRAGYGGPDANVVEARMRYGFSLGFPAVTSLEGYHDRRTGLGYWGLGQTPETDPRNLFRNGPAIGIYRERRERVIAGLGLRPLTNFEVLLSSSLTQRYVQDPEDPNPTSALTDVFYRPSIVGANRTERVLYSELALRYDSRATRTGVAPGLLIEGYGGISQGVIYESARFGRTGFQIAGFASFVRKSSILSPRLAVDALVPWNDVPIPFKEYTGQPTYRGFDNRRDLVSAVASLDYRWHVMRFVAARLFFDVARVFPSLSELRFDHLRWAAGFGFDLHTSSTQVGRVAVAGSLEGFNLLLTLGVPVGFGDRQHRE